MSNIEKNCNLNKALELSSSMNLEKIYLDCFCYVKRILEKQEICKSDFFINRAIDIRALARAYGVDVIEINMKMNNEIFKHGTLGYLDYYCGKWTIYVNEAMGDLTKRYIIAHELGHYFLEFDNDVSKIEYYKNPLFPKSCEEQICDIMASFLLMSIETVFEIMQEYVKKNVKGGIDMYEWLNHLGYELGVSDYHTVGCFQNVRYLAGFIYEKKGDYIYHGSNRECKAVYEKMLTCPTLF